MLPKDRNLISTVSIGTKKYLSRETIPLKVGNFLTFRSHNTGWCQSCSTAMLG
jgi:hypothetical protein